jgi:hypothetical protein
MALLAIASACYDASERPQTGGHTNWLQCRSLDDCVQSPEAVECAAGYCLDGDGNRIEAIDGGPRSEPIPSDWVRIDSPCGYSFEAPPDVREEPVQGIDSCVDQYLTEACHYNGGYGAFPTSYEEYESYPDYTRSQLEIDGLEAMVISARVEEEMARPYFAAIDFVPDSMDLYLGMYAYCRDEAGQSEAKLVFQTIVRPRPDGGAPPSNDAGDPCRSQCPLNVDDSNCVEQPLASFPDLEVTLEDWSATMCVGDPSGMYPYLLEAMCDDGTRLLYYGTGLSIERRYYDSSGQFLALETGADGGQGPSCNSSAYWPVRVVCENAVATNVVCGTATFMVGDPVPL